MKNWKTTVAGVCAIASAIIGAVSALVASHPIDYTTTIAAIMAGVGLLTAKDNNVTGGIVQQ